MLQTVAPWHSGKSAILVGWFALLLATFAEAGDWPQILGPTRNGKASGESLRDSWPAEGLAPVWKQKLGSGYAGVVVAGGKVLAYHRVGDQERVEAFDSASGASQWRCDFDAHYRGGIDPDTGPRCVPLIAGDAVYVYGAAGDMHAVSLATGKPLWSKPLYEELGGDEGYFGAGSTPILLAGKLLVNVGGRGAGIVALEPKTGAITWQATQEAASYSAPTSLLVGGKPQAIFLTRLNCVLADPTTGKVQVLFPFGMRGPTVNAATPLVVGKGLFTTASYGVGARMSQLEAGTAREAWANDDTLSSQYATPVEHNGFLYGIHGREDQGVAELRCVAWESGKVQWKQPGFGVAHLVLADGKLLVQKADGNLALAAADPAAYRELASCRVSEQPTRALPALSAGRLYVRTGSGGGQLLCLPVGR